MKKSLLVSAAVIAIFSFTSCKKDFTCTCQSSWFPDEWYDVEIKNTSKSKAEKTCKAMIAPELDGPRDCKLK